MKKQDIPIENALRAYLLHHEDKNHSAKTVRWYSDMRFLEFADPETKIGEIDADVIRRYLREVRRRDFKQSMSWTGWRDLGTSRTCRSKLRTAARL